MKISRQAEVGSRSWRHKRGVWTSENSDNLSGDKLSESLNVTSLGASLSGIEVFVIKEFRHICAKNGQSHQHPTFARGSARSAHWLDYWFREGDKCLEAGTDFDRSSGVAHTAVGGCSIE